MEIPDFYVLVSARGHVALRFRPGVNYLSDSSRGVAVFLGDDIMPRPTLVHPPLKEGGGYKPVALVPIQMGTVNPADTTSLDTMILTATEMWKGVPGVEDHLRVNLSYDNQPLDSMKVLASHFGQETDQ